MRARYALLGYVLSVVIVPLSADAAEKVTVGLDFTLSGYHAPWFVAQDKGYFAEEGLEVQMTRGYGSGDTVKKLATGAIDIGLTRASCPGGCNSAWRSAGLSSSNPACC